MAVDTNEIELFVTSVEKFAGENPRTMQWILHNFAALVKALQTVPDEFDDTAILAAIADLQAQIDALVIPEPFDPAALIAAIQNLQDQIDAIVIPPPPPPFTLPPGGV